MYYILICKFSFVENISIQFHMQFSMNILVSNKSEAF